MRRLVLVAWFGSLLIACCGGGPRDFAAGRVRAVVAGGGDQIHPDLDRNILVWFDLEGDPNGACHVPPYNYQEGWDPTCEGVVKSMDLFTGKIQTLSEVIAEETLPAVSNGLVAWRCFGTGQPGLCVTPSDRRELSFYPELGWERYYYPNNRPLAVDRGKVVWAEYQTQYGQPIYRLMQADLRTGEPACLVYLDQFPSEVAIFATRVAWTMTAWAEGGYRHQLEMMNIRSGERTVLVEGSQPCFGLGGQGGILAWKQQAIDETGSARVHVYYRDLDGSIQRADSDQAWVSSETPVAVGDGLLLWLDYRDGGYRVAAYDLYGAGEGLVSPEDSLIGATMRPAAGFDQVVWPDRKRGNWDLYLFHF